MDLPAIEGGTPIRDKKIFYGHQYIDDADCKAVMDVLKSDFLTCGPKIGELEEKLCKVTGAKHAVVCSNDTAALHISCMAAGIGRYGSNPDGTGRTNISDTNGGSCGNSSSETNPNGVDEVITTPMTFAASANCALYCGARPVFADIDPETYNIDPASIEAHITEHTKAVVAVDYTGQAVKLDEIKAICKKHNLVLIEDAAHAIGTKYKGQAVGSIADMTTFSFHPVKTITGGEGGAILTDNDEYYQKLLLYRSHGITHDASLMNKEPDGPWYYQQIDLGYNYRMTDIQAALLISQLDKLPSFSKRRKTESTLAFVMNFYESFVKQTEEKYPQIKKASVWNAIFSGIIEAEGIDNGISLINKFRRELGISDVDKKEDISTRIDSFIRNVKNHGYLPKQLYFAVKRFHRWYSLNRSASLSAQAEMIYELYETYRLFDLEEQYPAARTRFFLETVFYNSTQRFKDVLRELVRKQRHRKISKDESLKLINALHFEFELDEKETYFITRLGYPHLKPSDTAAMLSIKSEIAVQPNLVVQLQDDDGNIFTIRNPINPKEISKLHQLYLEANLNVNFRPEHHFLVAISDRGFIIGGAFYYRSDEDTVHMEKIVVSNRYRRKGISEGLMNELFSRIKSENIKFVTTGFFRPEYFYRFGFKIERKYSGLVKEL